jgi:hypothetical protein
VSFTSGTPSVSGRHHRDADNDHENAEETEQFLAINELGEVGTTKGTNYP